MVFVKIVDKALEVGSAEGSEEHATGGVFGDGAGVDADAFPFGHIAYLGHVFLESRRIRDP